MGFMDELKKLTHPYSEPEEDDYDDYDDEPLDNDPAPAPQSSRRSYSRSTPAAQDTQTRPTAHRSLRRGCRGLLQKAAERLLRAALNNSTFLRRAHGCAPCGITKK